MAEMTAQEATRKLFSHYTTLNFAGEHGNCRHYCVAEKDAEQIAALIQQQAATIAEQAREIERLQTREHRMIEYMRDVKNFAFTINEVANNAIEEAEVQK